MELALVVARRMLGQTAPNPAVGAVVADEVTAEVIARGWTQLGGRPHAEANALERAGERARGKTIYVTLEPCSYHGRTHPLISKTMPCAEAILGAGIARVVVATEDPNPEIAGGGIEVLRNAGIAVDVGVCGAAARWTMAGHILRMTEGRPFVQLKMAVSADGLIAPGVGEPVWVSGPEARAYAHLLRSRADAILVGRRTVEDDDPDLTCRLPGLEIRSPRRLILDSGFKTSPTAKLVMTSRRVPVTIFGDATSEPPAYPPGVEIRRLPAGPDGHLDLAAMLKSLGGDGVTRILVEGGPTLAGALVAADLVDEAIFARGTAVLGKDGRTPIGSRGLEVFDDAARWAKAGERMVGDNRLTSFRRIGRPGQETPV